MPRPADERDDEPLDQADEDIDGPQEIDLSDADEDETDTVACPSCGKPVAELADRCPHCGDWITPCGDTGPSSRIGVVAVIILLATGVALLWSLTR